MADKTHALCVVRVAEVVNALNLANSVSDRAGSGLASVDQVFDDNSGREFTCFWLSCCERYLYKWWMAYMEADRADGLF